MKQGKIDLKDTMDEFTSMVASKVNSLPPIKVDVIPYKSATRTPEEAVLLLGDAHIGHRTRSFSSDVFRKRIRGLLAGIREITDIQRQAYPVDVIHVCLTGDLVHNDLIGRFLSLDELEMPVINQFIKVAVPEFASFLVSLTATFKQVNVYGVRGNHGMVHKFAADTTNWDSIIYQILEIQLKDQPRISMKCTNDFFQLFTIQKHKFLLVHGDQIPMHLTLPWYGVTTRGMRWQGSMPSRFDYLVMGHFHVPSIITWNEMEIITNGTFVTDDEYVRKKLGLKTEPAQVFFGVHPKIGITWRYRINMDYANSELIQPQTPKGERRPRS